MCPPESLSSHASSSASPNQPIPPPPNFIPNTPLSIAAYNLAASSLPQAILNHSLRVFLYAKYFQDNPSALISLPYPGAVSQTTIQLSHLFVACILHDLGASTITDAFNGPQRFEVCGADAAVTLMQSFPDESTAGERHDIWTAISIHSSPGIAERYSTMSRLVRLAVLTDFGLGNLVEEEMTNRMERDLPRVEIERVLGDAVVAQALGKEDEKARLMKAPGASWPGDLVKSHKEDVEKGVVAPGGVNRAF